MANYVFHVKGMTCQGCVRAVETVVKNCDPKAEVSTHLPAGTVDLKSDVDAATLQRAIEGAGFAVTHVPPGKR